MAAVHAGTASQRAVQKDAELGDRAEMSADSHLIAALHGVDSTTRRKRSLWT